MAKSKLETLVARAGGDKYEAGEAFEAILALGAKAKPAAAAMRAFVADKEPRRALGARAVLAILGEDSAAHVDAIFAAAHAGTADAAAVAKVTLRALPGKLVGPGLDRGMQHAKPKARLAAVVLAGGTVTTRAAVTFERVLALLDDPDAKVRAAAMAAAHQFVAPIAPARPAVKLTPALAKRLGL
jgi:hypothetical protein